MEFSTYGSSNVNVVVAFPLTTQDSWQFNRFSFNLTTGAASTVGTNKLSITRTAPQSTVAGLANANIRDVVIHSQTMNTSVVDHEYAPERPRRQKGTDRFNIAWTNDGASFKSWALQLDYDIL